MNVDTLAPLGLCLAEVKNQRITKCPRISDAKVPRVDTIKKIIYGSDTFYIENMGHTRIKTLDLSFLFERLQRK